ncbi:MAG: histidine kinase, partial [Pseudonocardia sediminis]
ETDPARRLLGVTGLLAVLAALALALLRRVSPTRTAPPSAATLAVLAVAVAVSVPLLAPVGVAQGWETWAWLAGGVAGSVPVVAGWRAGAPAAVALTVVSAVVGDILAADGWTYAALTAGIAVSLALVHLVPLQLWTLVEQARAGRDAAARLAAAQERLRFAADVHDLLGHHLTVIALQAELAARTAASDAAAAAGHAEHARSLAATALGEMRRVVHGYREVDLPAQLTAVAEVLRASGVRCTAEIGEGTALSVASAAARAATAREAGTNVLRHSRAGWCTIALVHTPDGTELTVVNDGAVPEAGRTDGHSSGLRGVTDRLAAAGGALDTRLDGGVFTLRATVAARS